MPDAHIINKQHAHVHNYVTWSRQNAADIQIVMPYINYY